MTPSEAEQIAALINRRNQLDKQYTGESVLKYSKFYDFEAVDGKVAACIQRKPLQWYQWEVLHLSVVEEHEGKGLAKRLYRQLEDRAITKGVKLLQCTIREGNKRSEGFVTRRGFVKVNRFQNDRTGNNVGVWQKVLAPVEGMVESAPDARA